MNFDELNAIVAKEAGVDICPMCGTPFSGRDARQKTCGTGECKRLWKNQYLRERRLRLIAEDKELFNFRHAEAQRKSRHKKRAEQIERENRESIRQEKMSVEDAILEMKRERGKQFDPKVVRAVELVIQRGKYKPGEGRMEAVSAL